MNRVSLRSDLEIKPKFNDSVIPAWIRHSREGGNGIQRHGWYLNSDASLYYETTAPIRGRRVDRYAGTFFIYWGDETLNMIVKLVAGNRNP
uniref:Uncharacterized protein n=1 Tax=Candidatus Kentrum sp. SD TaxID=2126332 RepID=A0A451BKT2_9GAMM|nr:MAG: hypothetical protein BECKSD772D_GA0070982_102918 [Candidatus Kentron sp. SD]